MKLTQTILTTFIILSTLSLNAWGNSSPPPLFAAIEKGDLETIKNLVKSGTDVNEKYKGLMTPMMYAVSSGKVEIAKLLFASGAEINLKNSEVVKMKLTCALPGCGNLFEVLIYPRQSTVPKYCEAHRSEYRRQFFTRTRKAVSCNA